MADTVPEKVVEEWGPFRFHTRQVEGESIKIHFKTTGSPSAPQKIVFIHGLMATMTGWNPQIRYFEEKGEEYECLFLDNRGIGLSDVPQGPYTTAMMAEDVVSIVRQELGWKRYAVAGASMGGMITQHVGLLAGDEEVSHLLLLCTRAQSSFWYRLPSFFAIYKIVMQSFTDPKDLEAQAALVMPTLYSEDWLNKDKNREEMEERFVTLRGALPPHPDALQNQLAAVRGHELTDEEAKTIKEGKFKVGAISGNADELLPHSNSERMEEILDAQVKILEGVGHGLSFEAAEVLNEWIVEQLKR